MGLFDSFLSGNPLGSVLDFGLGLANTWVQQDINKDNMRRQHRYNLEMFDKQADYGREMYGRQFQDSMTMYGKQVEDERKMYEKQLADQKALISSQREYDSAQNQIKRLAAAGMNPKLAVQSSLGASGNVGLSPSMRSPSMQLPSQPSVSGSSSVTPGSYASPLEGYVALRNSNAQVAYTNSRTRGQNLTNEFDSRSMEARLLNIANEADKKAADTSLSRERRNLYVIEGRMARKKLANMDASIELELETARAQIADLKSQMATRFSDQLLKWFDLNMRKTLNDAQIYSLRESVAQGWQYVQQAQDQLELNQMDSTDYRRNLAAIRDNLYREGQRLGLSNEIARKTADYVVQQAQGDADYSTWKGEHPMLHDLGSALVGAGVGFAAGAVGKGKRPGKIKGFSSSGSSTPNYRYGAPTMW